MVNRARRLVGSGYLLPGDRNLASKARLHLAKYLSLFVGKYRPKLRELHTRLHQQSRLSLHLDLNLD